MSTFPNSAAVACGNAVCARTGESINSNKPAMVARCRLLWRNSWRKRPCLSTNMPTSPMKSNA